MDSEELTPEVEMKKPVIRDVVIEVLSSKQIEEIATIDGKQRLKDDLVKVINKRLNDGQIVNIFFAKFVIQ
jgi:flagellar FliL protein